MVLRPADGFEIEVHRDRYGVYGISPVTQQRTEFTGHRRALDHIVRGHSQ